MVELESLETFATAVRTGSFAAAVDTNTGQGCIGAGGLWLSTPR